MDLLFKLLSVFLVILGIVIRPFLNLVKNKKTNLPRIEDPILLMSAKKLAQEIRNKKLTSEQIVKTYIARIKQVNPVINAVVDERFEEAVLEARNIDKYIDSHKNPKQFEKTKPLLGVPISIKESCEAKDLSYAVGSRSRANIVATEDGDAVKNLKDAGAVILVVTNTPEFCASYETVNNVTGVTKNPYNVNKSSAGSSGGEAALLGSAGSVIGLGSDMGGSIRLPAMFNGIFGHKPTPGVVPIKGHLPGGSVKAFKTALCLGPLARYSEDLKLVLSAMAGANRITFKLDEEVNLQHVKVYFMEDSGSTMFGLNSVQKEIRRGVRDSVTHLKNTFGCEIMDYKFTDMKKTMEMSLSTLTNLGSPSFFGETDNIWKTLATEAYNLIRGKGKYYWPIIMHQVFLEVNFFMSNKNKDYYAEELRKLKDTLNRKLGINGVLIYPTFTSSAFYHFESAIYLPATMYLIIFNMLGFPATNIPIGLDKNGMPVGIQIIAAPKQDRLCLAVAEELEKKFGGWTPPGGATKLD